MKKTMIAMIAGGLMALGAMAAPTLATEQAEAAPVIEAEESVGELLTVLGHADRAEAVQGKVIQAQGFPWPPQGGGACENYEPNPGCYVVENDGEWCTERCEPDTQILQICDCVR